MALPLLAFAITPSAAKAVSFTGNYPVLETQVKAALQAPQQVETKITAWCLLTMVTSAGPTAARLRWRPSTVPRSPASSTSSATTSL
jgi:hypothetical protein